MSVTTPGGQYSFEYAVTFYHPSGQGEGIEVRKTGWGNSSAEAEEKAKALVESDAEYSRLKGKGWIIK